MTNASMPPSWLTPTNLSANCLRATARCWPSAPATSARGSQLLAIARAILILDQATSGIDTRTEARIQKALLRLMRGRTSFVIAHRLSTVRDAEKVVVINEGGVVEEGTHQQLLEQHSFYHHLYLTQFRGQAT